MKRTFAVIVAGTLLFAALGGTALAAGTGDDTSLVPNIATSAETAENTMYKLWDSGGGLPTSNMAPRAWLYTETCPQLRSYWCGVAAVKTALSYFGVRPTWATLAGDLGTTTNGTSMSRVDDVLRSYSGRSYTYRQVTNSSDFYNHVVYSLLTKKRPMIVDARIVAGWGPYRKDHAGHIICMDAFDWGHSTVRLNDSFNEATWVSGGGATGGLNTYDRSLVLNAVMLHPMHQIVF
jgi:hypothetical protein